MPVNSVIKIERLTLCGPLSRAVNPPPHQILRIDRELMIDDVMMHETRRHLCAKTREKDVVGIVQGHPTAIFAKISVRKTI